MFEDGEKQIERILQLTEKCPEALKSKCFEILLKAYADSASGVSMRPPVTHAPRAESGGPREPKPPHSEVAIPAQAAPRFNHTAKRLQVSVDRLAALFDFTSDPFTFAPYTIPGENKAEKTRNVALFVAAKAYLSGTTSWIADWREVRAECVNQGCYSDNNHVANIKAGTGLFKNVEAGKNLELTSAGQTAAHELLKTLTAGGDDAAK